MNTTLRILACAAALLAASAANANTYNYSYTFSNGSVVNGSFDGTASGNLINNLSNISAYLNGVQFTNNGHLINSSYTQTTTEWGIGYNDSFGTAVASFDGLSNNFAFTSLGPPQGGSYFSDGFRMVSSSTSFKAPPAEVYKTGRGTTTDIDTYSATRWSVTTAVPEPANYAMLLAGLGLVGVAARRRKAA